MKTQTLNEIIKTEIYQGKIVYMIIKNLAETKYGKDFETLFSKIDNEIFYSKGIIVKQNIGKKLNFESGYKRYYEEPITLKDGSKILVTSQWTSTALKEFLSITRKLIK